MSNFFKKQKIENENLNEVKNTGKKTTEASKKSIFASEKAMQKGRGRGK